MSVKAGITNRHILFKITMPLIGSDQFNMYNIIPIPVLTNGSLLSIQPTTENLAITAHGDRYYSLTQQQLSECLKTNQQIYLCPHSQSIYNKGAKANSCEVGLYNNETKVSCNVIEVSHDQWIQLNDKNQWIFALRQPIKLTAVCGVETRQIILEASGILKMNPESIIKNELFTLLGHQTFDTAFMASVTTHGRWSNLQNPKTAEPILLEKAMKPYNTQKKELIALQESLKKQQGLQFPSKVQETNHHLFGVGYTTLVLVLLITFYILVPKLRGLIYKIRTPIIDERTPTPAPRSQDFAINV